MARPPASGIVALWLALGTVAGASELGVDVRDEAGRPVADAVVSLEPVIAPESPMAPGAHQSGVIDQRDETFEPLVTLVRRGGTITFTNSDRTQHHVYSFSQIKRFQFLLNPGDRSPSLVFDNAGVAAIGCNIHDQMVTYVYVSDAPFIAKTGANGGAFIADIPPGTYRASAWHPDLKPGKPAPATVFEVAPGGGAASQLPGRSAPGGGAASQLPGRSAPGAHLHLMLGVTAKPAMDMHRMRGY
jgi:plastocyanin